MASELERGEGLKTSPFFGREIGQYHVQTVNFRASKKAPSIADTEPSQKGSLPRSFWLLLHFLFASLLNHSSFYGFPLEKAKLLIHETTR
jgi:hypothetical protein